MAAALRFTTGAWSGQDVSVPELGVKIGRDPTLDVVIPLEDQRFVSRIHAAITKEGAKYVLQDLDSSNGTFLNGRRVQRAELADGDEIQFGRQGPAARFRGDAARSDGVLAGGNAARPREPPLHAPAPIDAPPSQVVRRIVHEALATNVKRSRRRLAAAASIIVVLLAGGAFAMFRLGFFEQPEQTMRRLADLYENRVVLVEVGLSIEGQYVSLGNGSGFAADRDGLIVTNKHVVHAHLYDQSVACMAASLRRRGIAYDRVLTITIWRGGTEFRGMTGDSRGDRSLGYSTDHKTLSLVMTAPDTLLRAVTIQCDDPLFGGPAFNHSWARHPPDNNDLAVLRAITEIEPIPLAAAEPSDDEPVMVLGFPRGTYPLETTRAEPIRRMGRVLRTRDTIQVDAVVLHGNSGGPLIDRRGNVVGVTTRGPAESLNMAIKVEHVRRLLERVKHAS